MKPSSKTTRSSTASPSSAKPKPAVVGTPKAKKVLTTKAPPKEKALYKATKVPPKVKLVKRVLGGLVFLPKIEPKEGMHTSVRAWVDAGMPDNTYVQDNLDQLVMAGIPLCDVTLVRGLYIRKVKTKPMQCTVNSRYATLAHPPVIKKKVEGIFDADTKDHHRMSYG